MSENLYPGGCHGMTSEDVSAWVRRSYHLQDFTLFGGGKKITIVLSQQHSFWGICHEQLLICQSVTCSILRENNLGASLHAGQGTGIVCNNLLKQIAVRASSPHKRFNCAQACVCVCVH